MTIAGHDFQYTIGGCRCVTIDYNGKTCLRAWLDIKDATEADLCKPDIAHTGTLSQRELSEIVAERKRQADVIWGHLSDAASAGSR